jgi:hypothetical protein
MAATKIGIWGYPRSGKSSYIYSLNKALIDAKFTVSASSVDPAHLQRYERAFNLFTENHLYPEPTEPDVLDVGNQPNEQPEQGEAGGNGQPVDPIQQAQQDQQPWQGEAGGNGQPADPIQQAQQDQQPWQGEAGGNGQPAGEGENAAIGNIDEVNVLKLNILFPEAIADVKKLKFIGDKASHWVNKSIELYLPDHGGENWSLFKNNARMLSLVKYYGSPDFKGFMLFFDPTFYFQPSATLGINHPYNENLNVFLNLLGNARNHTRLEDHCAAVLTKIDEPRFQAYADPNSAYSEFYPHLLLELVLGETGFINFRGKFAGVDARGDSYLKCFCTSSVGTTGEGSNSKKPKTQQHLHTMRRGPNPQGVLEPFLWLISRIADQ